MNGFNWNSIRKEFRGIALIVAGFILLFHTLGILEKWLNWFLIFFALVLIIYGFMEAGIWQQILTLIKKQEDQEKN